MESKMIWANLASADLERTSSFYTKLGFKSNGSSGELTSILFGKDNFVINFFLTKRLESFMKSKSADPERNNEVVFSLSAGSKEEVDQWFKNVKDAGGRIFMEPQNYEQGYTFGFADPDGHKFNILHWPGM
jgi:uncharacterized protein